MECVCRESGRARAGTVGTGGVAIFIHQSISFVDVPCIQNLENIAILVSTPSGNSLPITTIYQPPNSSGTFFDDFELALELFTIKPTNMISIGDINCDFPSTSPQLKRLQEIMNLSNLHQIVPDATRVTLNSASLIDVILTNVSIHSECNVIPCAISDHDFIFTSVKFKGINHSHVEKTFRTFKHFDPEDFLLDLDNHPWHILNDMANIIFKPSK